MATTTPMARRRLNFESGTMATTPVARRLNFESEDEAGRQQKVLDYSLSHEPNDFVYRRTPYNQQKPGMDSSTQSSNSGRHQISDGEKSRRLQVPKSRQIEEDYDYDWQPSLMDVQHSVPIEVLRRMCGGHEFTITPSPTAVRTASCSIDFPSTPTQSPTRLPRSRADAELPPTRPTSGFMQQDKITGMNKAPLSLIAKEMNRPMEGPFYVGGPEHRVFKERMERLARIDGAATLSSSAVRVFSPSQISARQQCATNQKQRERRDRLEIFGIVDKLMINGNLIWPL